MMTEFSFLSELILFISYRMLFQSTIHYPENNCPSLINTDNSDKSCHFYFHNAFYNTDFFKAALQWFTKKNMQSSILLWSSSKKSVIIQLKSVLQFRCEDHQLVWFSYKAALQRTVMSSSSSFQFSVYSVRAIKSI